MAMFSELARAALACRCPRCGVGRLFAESLDLTLVPACAQCGLHLADNDNGDGPAVFLIFVLGFALVPLAVLVEWLWAPPLWVHGVVWSLVALGITLLSLRPLKALVLTLQYRYRPETWR